MSHITRYFSFRYFVAMYVDKRVINRFADVSWRVVDDILLLWTIDRNKEGIA